ncbi:MAG: O-antigen polysaccharide polymerase Wzy [Verrucomicrobia bacterium]|nr:MAG: O-antigen polysaccharide polymerase Wzy [Verrucomicrobiota bacterium]
MTVLLITIFLMQVVWMIAPAFWRREYRLQFPCLAGFTVIFHVVLPAVAIAGRTELASVESVNRFLIMANLCLAAAWLGYSRPMKIPSRSMVQFNPRRLRISAIVLVLFGLSASVAMRNVIPEYDWEKGGMTGIATILLTFAAVMRYGFIIAAILMARQRKWNLWWLVLPQLWGYGIALANGRRSPTGELAIIICMLVFFYRRWVVPMWVLMLGILAAALMYFNIADFRSSIEETTLKQRFTQLFKAESIQSISARGMAEAGGYVEILNAVKFMEARAHGGHYTLGRHFWNQIVFGFVPAQFVGQELKESLMIPLEDDTQLTGFEKPLGTCESGVAEAFMAFGYFGCVLFYLLGRYMRWLWEGAMAGSILHQFLLMLSTLGAIMSFSIQLWTLINLVIGIALFCGMLFWWSREKRSDLVNPHLRQSARAKRRHRSRRQPEPSTPSALPSAGLDSPAN